MVEETIVKVRGKFKVIALLALFSSLGALGGYVVGIAVATSILLASPFAIGFLIIWLLSVLYIRDCYKQSSEG